MTKMVLITGNTFPVKDQIKALGGKWDADSRGWKVPADKADAVRALVSGAPTPAKRDAPKKPVAKRREIYSSAPIKPRRELQPGEQSIQRPSQGKGDGYEVGTVVRFSRVKGGGGKDGHIWTIVAAGKHRETQYSDDTREGEWTCWCHARPATPEEAAPIAERAAAAEKIAAEKAAAEKALYAGAESLGLDAPLPAGCERIGSRRNLSYYVAPDGTFYYTEYVYDFGTSVRKTSATPADIERAKALGMFQ